MEHNDTVEQELIEDEFILFCDTIKHAVSSPAYHIED